MYENEPKLFFNYPLSGCVGVMASVVLVTQIFTLLFTSSLFWFLFETVFCFFFVFVLSVGVRRRKLGMVSCYVMWLVIYIFWSSTAMILYIWADVSCDHNPKMCYDSYCNNTGWQSEKQKNWCDANKDDYKDLYKLHGGAIAALVIFAVSTTISLLLCCIQIRFCFLLYKHIRTERRLQTERQVTYQHRPANSPPVYTQDVPWPEKPPGYAEAQSPAHLTPVYTPTEEQGNSGARLETGFPPVTENQETVQRPDPFELTTIDLNETPVFGETPVRDSRTSSLVSESVVADSTVSTGLSETNPFKSEIEHGERQI